MGNTEIEQMKRKSDGTAFYPRTILEAVMDKESNIQLDDIVRSINCIYLPQVQFENITDDLFATRCLIPRKFRRKMMFVTRIDDNGKLVLEYYTGSTVEDHTWGDSRFWQPLVDSEGNTVIVRDHVVQGDTLTFDQQMNKLWIEKGESGEREPAGEPLTFFKMVPNEGQHYFTLYGTKDPGFESWTDSQWRQNGIFLGNVTNLLKVWRYFNTMADAVEAKSTVPDSGLVGIREDDTWQLYANEQEGYIRLGGMSVSPSDVISASMFNSSTSNDDSAPSCMAVYNFVTDLVKDGVLTIKKNGQTLGTFSANASSSVQIDIDVPDIIKTSGESLVSGSVAIVEDPNDKVELINSTNMNSTVKYPSVKALVEYVDSKTASDEIVVEAQNLSDFLQFVWDRRIEGGSKRYRLDITGLIDFTKPGSASIKVTNNGSTSTRTLLHEDITSMSMDDDQSASLENTKLYNPATKTYYFGNTLRYTKIVGKGSSCGFVTNYLRKSENTDNADIYTGDTFSLASRFFNVSNLILGGSINSWIRSLEAKYHEYVNGSFVTIDLENNPKCDAESTYLIDWQRAMLRSIDNFKFVFDNCTISCIGHFSGTFGSGNSLYAEHSEVAQTGALYSDEKIPGRRKYNLLIEGLNTGANRSDIYGSTIEIKSCNFVSGCFGKTNNNHVTNAPVYFDFSNNPSSRFYRYEKLFTIKYLSKELSDPLSFTSSSHLSDSEHEKGLVDIYINTDVDHQGTKWKVTNDGTAIVRSNVDINMRSTIFVTDVLISDTSDPRGFTTLQEKLDALSN